MSKDITTFLRHLGMVASGAFGLSFLGFLVGAAGMVSGGYVLTAEDREVVSEMAVVTTIAMTIFLALTVWEAREFLKKGKRRSRI